jgi:hypothetical protein
MARNKTNTTQEIMMAIRVGVGIEADSLMYMGPTERKIK